MTVGATGGHSLRRGSLPEQIWTTLLGIYVTAAESMAKWRFAGSATHRHFSRRQLESELRASGVGPADFVVDLLILPGEIEGLLAVVRLD